MDQQIIPAAQLVPKYQSIGRCNNYVVLQISKVPNTKDTIKFNLDTQDITYTMDMFRDTLHLPVETLDNPFVAPVNIKINKVTDSPVRGVLDDQRTLDDPWLVLREKTSRKGESMTLSMALEHNSLSPRRNCQEHVSHGDKTDTTSNELDLLFSPMFDELLNGSTKVVSKSSAVSAADALNQRQQLTTPLNTHTTPLNTHTTPAPTCQTPPITPSVISSKNINQAQPHVENDEVADDEFINIFSTPVQDKGETSSRHVDSSNMHTFYQRYLSKQRWTKDHPLEQVIGNPSQSVRTRRQL
nr:hypothetical protein [Tanacetum cinerariifolium]